MALTCCAGDVRLKPAPDGIGGADLRGRAERRSWVQTGSDGSASCLLSIPSIHCGGCIGTVERALTRCEGVRAARVNLSLRRVRVTLDGPDTDPLPVIKTLERIGYPATPVEPGETPDDGQAAALLRALAVAGFGVMNIMLMSVSVWAGAEGATRQTFHLLSGLVAVPVALYAGRPFYRSAWTALRARRLNMDVPITVGILLTLGLSIFETARGGHQAFFDAAVTLIFFLLIGRYLDRLMRDRARSAVAGLARLASKGAVRLGPDGAQSYLPLDDIEPGMVLRIAAGERVPVDAEVLRGASDLDRALVTGELAPVAAGPGDALDAGTMNLTGALDVRVVRAADDSCLAEMMRLLETAEQGRGAYVRLADRAARLYAPVVHLMALATFAGWLAATGGDWQTALFVAISVLIITCPCALGLAVPVVHVVAAGRLFRAGILMKDGSALERLAGIDRVVFDKTGTLTTGRPILTGGPCAPEARAAARTLALHSTHPVSRAVAEHIDAAPVAVQALHEVPGCGVEGIVAGRRARLGHEHWVAEIASRPADAPGPAFALEGCPASAFGVAEILRSGALDAVTALQAARLEPEMLSGDGEAPAGHVARDLGLAHVTHDATPAQKIARLDALRAEGRRVLMVGDGLNDAAALAAAYVSMAPASASDAGRAAADFIFIRDRLDAVVTAREVALGAARLVRQNFGLAVLYNCIAIPLAVAGLVTPLVAALAMSSSSVLVVANALRLNRGSPLPRRDRVYLRPRPTAATVTP